MSEAQTILSMIEQVDPEDTAKLDEINLRFAFWLEEKPFTPEDIFKLGRRYVPSWVTSRDALKAIRPEGWEFRIFVRPDGKHNECFAGQDIMSRFQPTEELAELHAIIQAIDYERKQ